MSLVRFFKETSDAEATNYKLIQLFKYWQRTLKLFIILRPTSLSIAKLRSNQFPF